MTEKEWARISPRLLKPMRRGRPRTTSLRGVANGTFYLLQSGCQWDMLPKSFPPWQTVYGYFHKWQDDATLTRLHDVLLRKTRQLEGREESPSYAIVDSQSAKTGPDAREMVGYDAGKKVKGRKRHIVANTIGLILKYEVHNASIQGRDGAALVFDRLTNRFPFIEKIYGDGGYIKGQSP